MQSEYRSGSSRHVNSVSDLYISDEISVLLEEIQSLEPSSYRPEDIQDFEIAGSQTGGTGGGGRTSSSVAELETPGECTIHSWDSHANYKHHIHGSSPTQSVFSGVIIYWDESYLKSYPGYLKICLAVMSLSCLLCLCTAGTFRLNLFLLPLLGRIRFMIFVTLFTSLVTCAFFFIEITHLIYLFPFNWGKIGAVLYISISVLFLMGSSLIIQLVLTFDSSFQWVPMSTRNQLFIVGLLGYVCGVVGLVIGLSSKLDAGQYRPVNEDPSSITLQERRDVVRYSPSPCPSIQPAVVTPHWAPQDTNILLPASGSMKTRDHVSN